MLKYTIQRIFQVLHIVSLSAWLGAIAMSAIVAGTVFQNANDMKPHLGTYENYAGDHALLTGGLIAGSVFFIVDAIQFISAAIALGSFITMIVAGYSINTFSRVLRSVVLLATMGLLSYHLFILMPGFTADLSLYWEYAAAGDTAQADVHKNDFMALHETAANTLKGLTFAVLACLILSVWTAVGSASSPASTSESKS